jgi:hypothetical protein
VRCLRRLCERRRSDPHFVAFCKTVGAFCIWEWGIRGLGCNSEAFMNRFTSLPFMFRVVAVVELLYALTGLLTPPSMVFSVTGWVLSPDGPDAARPCAERS